MNNKQGVESILESHINDSDVGRFVDISMMFGSNSHFLLEVQTLFIIQLVNNGPNCE